MKRGVGKRSPRRIEVAWRHPEDWRARALLRRVARAALDAQRVGAYRVEIAVVAADEMASLHRRSCRRAGPTDVLTFDLSDGSGVVDAQLVVCADVAMRAAGAVAGRRRHRAELALYVVHGILHLTGHDDHTPTGFRRMHRREDQILRAIGLGPVYSAGC